MQVSQSQQVPQQQGQEQEPEKAPLQKAIRVLSLDGGGIRGVAVARILEAIEERTGKRIHELFDVIVGTSTGGLLAVMMSVEIPPVPAPRESMSCHDLAVRDRQFDMRIELNLKAGDVLTATQARELYEKKAKRIFHEADAGFLHKLLEKIPGMEKIIHFFQTKYEKGVGLKKIVKDLYIHNSFQHAKTCCGVVVTERGLGTALLLNSTHAKVQGDHNYHHNISLTKMVRATSAAPTYFKSIHVHHPCVAKHKHGDKKSKVGLREKLKIKLTSALWGKRHIEHKLCERQMLFFEDGGVSCNNPSKKGLNYAKELLKLQGEDHHEYQFQIYSLGTGATNYDEVDPAHEMIEKLESTGGKLQSGNWNSLTRLFNDPFSIRRLSYRNHIKVQNKLHSIEKRTKIPQKYFRLQFQVTKEQLDKLDDSSKKHIENLIDAADDCIDHNRVFEDIISALEVPVQRPEGLNKVKPILKLANFEMRLCMMDHILRKINHQFGRGEMRLCMTDKIFEAINPDLGLIQMRNSMMDRMLERVQSDIRMSCLLRKSSSLVCQPVRKSDSCRL